MVDASADAAGCVGPDQDGDGICDAIDLCPTIADPGQVDLDGDHIGWSCDPVESLELQLAPGMLDLQAVATLDTFVSRVAFVGGNAVVAVSPLGKSLARSDSGLPGDAWSIGMLQPYLIGGPHVIWSRGSNGAGETGELDLTNAVFTHVADGNIEVFAGDSSNVALFALRTSTSSLIESVAAPIGSALVQLRTAPDGVGTEAGFGMFAIGNPPLAAFASRTAITFNTYTYDLQTHAMGSNSADDVIIDAAPALGLDEVKYAGGEGGELSFCVRRGATVSYVEISAGAISSVDIPLADCNVISMRRVGATVFLAGIATGNLTILSIRDGVFSTVLSEPGNALGDMASGDQIPIYELDLGTNHRFWVITPDGTPLQLGASLLHGATAYVGNTVYLVGIQPTSNGFGSVELIRYRPGAAPQQVTVAPTVADTTTPTVIATAEGAAIVEAGGVDWAVPSTTMTVVPLSLRYSQGGARGTHTLLVGQTSAPTSQPALYAYDEIGGSPRLTQLSTEQSGMSWAFLDTVNGPTSVWFSYSSYTTPCGFARLVTDVGGVPALDSIACDQFDFLPTNGAPDIGGNANVIADRGGVQHLYVLTPDGSQEVAHGSHIQLIQDETAGHRITLGWTGLDAMGGFACMAAHPERCWTIVDDTSNGLYSQLAAVGHAATDGTFTAVRLVGGAVGTLTVLRTINNGDRPQPLL
jgi:hypothetical protein